MQIVAKRGVWKKIHITTLIIAAMLLILRRIFVARIAHDMIMERGNLIEIDKDEKIDDKDLEIGNNKEEADSDGTLNPKNIPKMYLMVGISISVLLLISIISLLIMMKYSRSRHMLEKPYNKIYLRKSNLEFLLENSRSMDSIEYVINNEVSK